MWVLKVLLVSLWVLMASLSVPLVAGDVGAQDAAATRKGIELARPGTLQQYIDRYTGGEDVGCTIGGQTFRNFRVRVLTSILEDKLKGDHPSPPLRADQIIMTPVNYVKDGRRWVGFRFTNTPTGLEILGGPRLPKDYEHVKDYDVQNCGFLSNYDIRFEAHGTSKWQRGKVAYAGMVTDRLVNGTWSEAANIGPGSRANMGCFPRPIGVPGSYQGINPKTPGAGAWGRLCSVSRGFGEGAKAPRSNENWFEFVEAKAPTAFEIREGFWPEYGDKHDPGLGAYGIWFRVNCWDKTETRWRADYIEYSFSNTTVTDEIWTADGKNRAVQAPDPRLKQPEKFEEIPPPVFTGEKLVLQVADGVNMQFVLIPAGKFVMGSAVDEPGRCDDEGPQRVVTITKPFYMGVFEVTQAQYQTFMGKAAAKQDDPQLPALASHYVHAVDFCRKVSAKTGRTVRLPTEAEWERACRAGGTTRFSFGDDDKALEDCGWFVGNSDKSTHPVGQKKPNVWGLYDMHGNAWEWCSDWYSDSFLDTARVDPRGPESGEYRVVRGGSWSCFADGCRSASRVMGSHSDMMDSRVIGFRVVCEVEDKR